MKRFILIVLCLLFLAPSASAQNVVTETVTDVTTYVPMTAFYVGSQLDWNSSQPYFAHGNTEVNPRFTQSGKPFSAPVSYAAGNRLIVKDALEIGAWSVANNVAMRLIEHHVAPEHRATWKRLSKVERIAFATVTAFVMSSEHFSQWQNNLSDVRYIR